MPDDQRASTMGPAIFFGLLVYSLATYAPPDVTYANPADANSLDAVVEVLEVEFPPAPQNATLSPMSPSRAMRRSFAGIQIAQQKPEQPFAADHYQHPPISVGLMRRTHLVSPVLSPTDIQAPQLEQRLGSREPADLLEQASASDAFLLQSNMPTDIDGDFVGKAFMQTDEVFALGVPRLAGFRDHPPLPQKASLAAPFVGPLLPDSPMTEFKAVVVSGDNVHLRDGPGVRFAVLGKVPLGATVQVLGTLGNWRRVLFSKNDQLVSGWMYVDYLPNAQN